MDDEIRQSVKREVEFCLTHEGETVLKEETKKLVLTLFLLVNTFESNILEPGKTFSQKEIENFSNGLFKEEETWFSLEKYEKFGKYVADRYNIKANSPDVASTRLDLLGLKDKEKNIVFPGLVGFQNGERKEMQLRAFLTIAYRLRHNLYHGEKPVSRIEAASVLISHVNGLLSQLLLDMAEHHSALIKRKH